MPISPAVVHSRVFGMGATVEGPAGIAGLVGWWVAGLGTYQNSDGSVAASADGDPVGYWADQSGNAAHATQATAGARPALKLGIVNGRAVTRWSAAQQMGLAKSLSVNPGSVFAVLKPSATASYRTIVGSNISWPVLRLNTAHKQEFLSSGSAILGTSSTALSTAGFSVVGVTYASPAITFYLNGAADGTASSAQTGGTLNRIAVDAGTAMWNGDIAELLVYSSVLSAGDRGALDAYLKAKYGLT